MPNIGTTELIIILIIVLMIFGVGKLPKVSRDIRQGIQNFRQSTKLLQKENKQQSEKTPPG